MPSIKLTDRELQLAIVCVGIAISGNPLPTRNSNTFLEIIDLENKLLEIEKREKRKNA